MLGLFFDFLNIFACVASPKKGVNYRPAAFKIAAYADSAAFIGLAGKWEIHLVKAIQKAASFDEDRFKRRNKKRVLWNNRAFLR